MRDAAFDGPALQRVTRDRDIVATGRYAERAEEWAAQLLEIVRRYGPRAERAGNLDGLRTRGSTIVTSNKTVAARAQTFGDEALAAAILDNLLHDAEVLAFNGQSFRLKGRLDSLRARPDGT